MYFKHSILFRILGWAYMVFYAIYVDDNCCKGPTPNRASFRATLLQIIFDEFGIPISPKTLPLPEPQIEVKCAGNTISEHGYTCDQTVYDTIDKACDFVVKA